MQICDLEEKRVMGVVEEREPWSQRKVREEHRGECKTRTLSPKPLAGKIKGADCPQFLQPVELKDLNF